VSTAADRTSRSRMAFLSMLSIVYIYPFIFLASTAVRTQEDYISNPLGLPRSLTTENLKYAWDGANIDAALIASGISVGLSVVILVLASSAAAYWFLRHPGRWSRILMLTLFALWAVPFIVYVVPLYVLLAHAHLLNSLVVLAFIYAAMNIPFGVYLLHSYYVRGIPQEVLEAAEVDGASTLRIYVSVILPLGRPAMSTLAALGFVWSWGDLLASAFVMQDPQKYTLTLAASTLVTRTSASVQPSAAAALISLAPVLLVFLFAQRGISRGFSAGAGK
jgi:ABC-type glycerol-3-phosphate transport system permease component